ncbi:MAG: exopolysaccharide biosynthesis protein, partial [Limnochordia bacterium]|nr:exopolysaccharide biosynthesis protein [Limnochordia bacterium]
MSLSRTLSDTLACALEQDSVSIESLIAATGQQSYGLLFILVGLFIMIPLPPGGGILPGSLIFF